MEPDSVRLTRITWAPMPLPLLAEPRRPSGTRNKYRGSSGEVRTAWVKWK